ncbi:hypothetical protein ACFVYT_40060 [Streptomyces sp. NPDC058290]|uniref:hypothetical protein n=1 Tax=Streptomyces sp. NPDC058290 TaxID=3346426 RepID=UPI0036EA2A9C
MAPAKNEVLAAWMDQHGLSAGALAELVNDAMTDITGRRGTTGERHAFRWLSGESAWPQHRYRRALEAVTGLAAPDLGFVPRRAARPARAQDHPEEPVLRRTFLTATTGTTVSLTPLAATRPAVGTADVARLRSGLDTLLALDDARGGHAALERAALAGALHTRRVDTIYGQALVSPSWIEDLPRGRHGLPRKDYPFDPAFLGIANTIHTGSVVTRNPADGPVRFDEDLHHCEDWDFLLALHRTAGHRFARLDSITSVYHQVPRPGAVHSAYQTTPTPFTLARAVIYDRWPAALGRAQEYREWFRQFDHHLDMRIASGLPVPPHVYESAVRSLHATFTPRRSPDPDLLDHLFPTPSRARTGQEPTAATPPPGAIHAAS